MKIDLVPDRMERRADPVEAGVGVFAHLKDGEASEAEAKRLGSLDADEVVTKFDENPTKTWGIKDVLKRVTDLYKRLGKPRGV